MLAELWEKEGLASSPKCVKERVCMKGVRVLSADVRMVFVQSGLISGSFCARLDDYNKALIVSRASSAKESATLEQKGYRNPECRTQRRMPQSFVLVREKKGWRKEVWAGRVLLLSCFPVKRENDRDELAILHYMEYAPSLDATEEALKCVRLQLATSDSGEEDDDVERKDESSELEMADGWLALVVFSSIVNNKRVVRPSTTVHPSTTKLP